ncbi:Glycine--tRNA ligase [Saliniradius amylolyticus]|uniref:Glycine--tRNA ligase beta subunit n=1 Tax=Saliniradius amylolyticus TaxID=2183582 RepID=A0A2S2DZS6_9ALTE|nr:glycine--tRNA ligase subunit beta [Saliniradius amylolyticus]AWL10520.1 Glycine--tRNA ligase [Saliniradius amylolyticus]
MHTESLLIEIGTEELPPKALQSLSIAFADGIEAGLEKAELSFSKLDTFAAPRRLGVLVSDLSAQQADKVVEKRGPAISAAFDGTGEPTKAALGWARGQGIELDDAQRLKTDKGEWLLHKAEVKGQALDALLPEIVSAALNGLPIPKPMRWGSSQTQFIRPVHTVTLLYGAKVIDAQILGINSGRNINGHRFHSSGAIELAHANDYQEALHKAYVIADFDQRKARIRQQLEDAAKHQQAVVDMDDDLLNEVTALVEWPEVLVASFDQRFLDVPKEALIYTMKDDQKYFPLLSQDGQLLPRFAFVANIDSKDPQQVIKGNERVIRPRLADAEFFFNTDRKQSLESRLDSLGSVLFQKQLGTLADKSKRIAELAAFVASQLEVNQAYAHRAGLLSKTDLMTQMVMEFPDVQGVMGMHYARFDGEPEVVAKALFEQYLPRFSGDILPSEPESAAVAIADKVDTLVGIFGIGQSPKGDKDPFALRRAAIGLIRIMVEGQYQLDLLPLLEKATTLFGDKLTAKETEKQVLDFVLGRFRAWYQEQGVDANTVQAVLERRPTSPVDFDARIQAVKAFRSLEAAESLAAANKRVANILAKSEVNIDELNVDHALLSEAAETQLAEQVSQAAVDVNTAVAELDYKTALYRLSELRDTVDAFFDSVMVMHDDPAIRTNRLAILGQLRQLFLKVADISVLN